MKRAGWIDTALGIYPAWWRERYGEEVRAVSSDAISGGQSPFRVTAGLVIGAVRTRISGRSTPRQFLLWACRTRAWIIFTTVPALVVLPLFFLTFKQGQGDGLPLVPSATLTRSGQVAYDSFGLLAVAGLLVTGVVIGAYVVLTGVVGGRRADEHRTGRMALKMVLSAGLVIAAVTEGAMALFALVALGFTVWGSVTVAHRMKRDGVHDGPSGQLAAVPVALAVLAGTAWIGSQVVGPHSFLDRHGVDLPLDGHPGLAHGLVIGAAASLGIAWLVTSVSLILVVRGTRPSKDELRLAAIVGTTVSVLLWVMAGAGLVSVLALGSQGALHRPGMTVVTTSWGHLWLGGALSLLVAATASTSGAVASWRSWSVTSRLEA